MLVAFYIINQTFLKPFVAIIKRKLPETNWVLIA